MIKSSLNHVIIQKTAGEHKTINYNLVPKIIKQMQWLVRLILPECDPATQSEPGSSSPPHKKSRLSIPAPLADENADSRSSFTSEVDVRPNHRMHPMTDKRRLTLYRVFILVKHSVVTSLLNRSNTKH